ncbi:MAG: hypothetical protein P8Z68_03585, partial [Kineosporiaceae bacterium]
MRGNLSRSSGAVRRRAGYRTFGVVVAALATIIGTILASVPGVPARPGGSVAASPGMTGAAARAAAVLLDRRARALRDADRSGWLAGIDPAATDFRTRQDVVFDRLAAVPVTGWRYTVLGPASGKVAGEVAGEAAGNGSAAGPAVVLRVRLTYRLAPDTRDLSRVQFLTVRYRPAGWVLVSDRDGPTERDLWDLGPVTVTRGAHVLVVAATSTGLSAQVAADAGTAVTRVGRVWDAGWPRTVVVLVPADLTAFAGLVSRSGDAGSLSGVAAVTTGPLDRDPRGRTPPAGTADRVILNATAYRALTPLGREVVLTHELTHVATRAAAVVAPPAWLEEGLADYIAFLGTGLDPRVIARDALAEAARGHLPATLPGPERFDTSRGLGETAYQQAWLACRLVAGDDPARLIRFYREVTAMDPPSGVLSGRDPHALRAGAFREVLGGDEEWFLRQ